MASRNLFFEEQDSQRCAIHAVNNLMQRQAYTKDDFDSISYSLTPFACFRVNPHKSCWGVGNYDANVLIRAIESLGFEVGWHDRRKAASLIDFHTVFGLIINSHERGFLSGPHWSAVRQINGVWYDLDSKLRSPEPFGSRDALCSYLQHKVDVEEGQILTVTKKSPLDDNRTDKDMNIVVGNGVS